LRSAIGADEQAAAALLLAQRNAGCEMTLTALSIGDERALHWLRYFAALGFEQPVLLERRGFAFCAIVYCPTHCRLAASATLMN
jgi:electron transfer flavoprotein alpha/beta subunit